MRGAKLLTPGARERKNLAALGFLLFTLAVWGCYYMRGEGAVSSVPAVRALPDGALAWSRGTLSGEMPGGWRGLLLGAPLDTGTATAADWDALPGVGGKLAAELAKEGRAAGGFDSPEALLRVKGIGPKKLEALRGWVILKNTELSARDRG